MAGKKGRRRAKGDGALFQRGDGRWQGEVLVKYVDGKPKYKTVTAKTQEACRKKLEELKRQHEKGVLNLEKLSVADYLEQWLETKAKQVKPRTVYDYRYNFTRYVNPKIGALELTKANPLIIQGMLNGIADEVSADRANKVRRDLYGAFRQAVKWRLLMSNPIEATDTFKHEKAPMQMWQPDEALRFIEAAKAHPLFALFYLAMATGMRRGELLGLRWQDIEGSSISVRQTYARVGNQLLFSTPKTRKGVRRIPLSEDVLHVLAEHRLSQDRQRNFLAEAWQDYGLVFTSEVGTPIDPDNLKRARYRLADVAGVPRVRLHDLRHLYASLMIKRGFSASELAERLGHARSSFTLDVYTHLFEEQKEAAAVSLMELLSGCS